MTSRSSTSTAVALLVAAGCASGGPRATPRPTTPNAETIMNARPAPATWFSLPADDLEASAALPQPASGWKVEPLTTEDDHAYDFHVVVTSPSDGSYTPGQPGRVNGCIVKRAIGVSTPVVLIEVNDLDQAAKDVVAAGGTVVSGKIPMRS